MSFHNIPKSMKYNKKSKKRDCPTHLHVDWAVPQYNRLIIKAFSKKM